MRLKWAAIAVMAVYCFAGYSEFHGWGSKADGQEPSAKAPFAPLSPTEQTQLREVLRNWEHQSKGTKTLELKFLRFHYDGTMAPSGHAATKAEGEIKYAAPDQGLIRVDQLVIFNGMVKENPSYKAFPDRFGEHWVCNGKQLIEFDRTQKECKIEELPPGMQGKNIINSPLPFVFNLDAAKLLQRYWVRLAPSPAQGVILLEVWPKTREDRSQYRMVQVALDEKNYLPRALVMFAPNFDAKTAGVWDHYEFRDVRRNSIGNRFSAFLKNFIPEKPPKDWKIVRSNAVIGAQKTQQAKVPGNRRQ